MTMRRVGIVRRAVAVALLLLLLPVSPGAIAQQAAGVELRDVTVSTQPDSVTVLVKTSGEPKYQAELMDHPYRLVVDFDGASYGWRKTPLSVDADPLKQIRGSQYKRDVARVVVELTRNVGYAIREESNGLAIVIPTSPSAARGTVEPAVATAKPVAVKPVATKPVAMPTPRPQVTAALAVKPETKAEATPETPKAEAAKPDPMQPPTTRGEAAAPMPAPPQVAQAQVPPAPTAPPQPAPVIQPAPGGGPRLISLDFKDADVVNLLRILAAESGRNVVIGEDVKGKMSITLRNVPWDLALDTVLEAKSLVKIERDNVMRIVSQDQLAKEREAKFKLEESKVKAETEIRTKQAEAVLKEQEALARQVAAQQAAEELAARGPLKEETIRLSYADPEEVAKTLEGILGLAPGGAGPAAPTSGPGVIPAPPFSQLFGPGQTPVVPPSPSADVLAKGITIKAHKPTNSLFMRLYAADMERIKVLIREKLDIPLPQVKIEARMEILARNDLFALGVQWGGGGVATGSQATLVGRGFTSTPGNTLASGGIPASRLGPLPNPNLNVGTRGQGQILPVSPTTGLPTGSHLVNPA